ncbi:mycofactocin biosynthesis glycosyltransferase MftF [Nocardioides panacisoli]|uniref:mycofactocin biosynthesis glycosyltransferase MftF n=1 Tax=Nocardioides panacisoli TaxID=627624 RepID=UPI001C639EC6|nr:mycofactocin biosynthesis glycosyltransferase MftF [Nocardioides panacisoli]QYJ02626.1 mycofactocin biosynthesis glycosyltransferase MftF [Nocardioides panacisoli]
MSGTTRYPDGFEVRIRSDVRRVDGDLLLGGSPMRAVRLTSAALGMVQGARLRVTGEPSGALAARLVDGNLADPVLSGTGVDAGDLTVVVPVRDRPEQLGRALADLAPLRVLVVDDGSLEPAAVAVVAASHGAEVLPLPVNRGPAAARNAGLRAVTTPYVAFVDSDVHTDAATLLRLTRHFADRSVALVGPLVRSRSRAARPRWFERFDEQDSSLALGTRGCSVRPGAAVGWLPSACLVARVDLLGDGFSEDMRVGEDVDLVWRLVDRGHVVRYDPGEVARHDTRTTVRGWLGRKLLYGTGGADLAARHGRKGAPAIMSATTAVAAAAVMARRRWSLPVALAGFAYGTQSLRRRLPESSTTTTLSVGLGAQGLGWAVRQQSALLLRHWWPATALLATRSTTVRRAVVTALVVDVVAARIDDPDGPYHPLGRRLDDLAYGSGLWLGALRSRSITCLLPRRPGDTYRNG